MSDYRPGVVLGWTQWEAVLTECEHKHIFLSASAKGLQQPQRDARMTGRSEDGSEAPRPLHSSP